MTEFGARYRALFDAAPVALLVTARDLKILDANPAATALFGVEPPSVMPESIATLMNAADLRRLEDFVDRLPRVGRTDLQTPMRRLDGATFEAGVQVTSSDEELHWAIVDRVTDGTDRAQIARVEAEFVENAAHQLRTPITAIASSVAALDAGARDEPESRDRFLAHIGRETVRMGRVVEALLTLAAHQRGIASPSSEIVRLRPFIQDLVLDHGAAEISVHIQCPRDAAVVGDRELLTQALVSVVENAVAHAKAEVHIDARVENGVATIDVNDDGAGVPAESRGRIFERFYRNARNRRGSGLGLAVAAAAAEAMSARLELLPGDGGATFRLTAPGAQIR